MPFKGILSAHSTNRCTTLAFARLVVLLLCTFFFAAAPLVSASDIIKAIDVEYVGPASVSKARILANVSTKVGDTLDQTVVENDIKSLYASGDVESVRMFAEPYSGGQRLIILVETRASLGRVHFLGNEGIDDKTLRKEVELAVGTSFDDAKLEEARRAIAERYAKKGYSDATVTYKTGIGSEGNLSSVTFIIDEGEKSLLKDIEFVGVTAFKPKELEKTMKIKERRIWRAFTKAGKIDNLTLEGDIVRIEDLYKDAGYLNAEVTDVQRRRVNKKKVDLVITVNEGEIYDVNHVGISGIERADPALLESQLQLAGGARYSGKAMKADMQMLEDHYGRQGYADVRVMPRITNAGSGNVIDVEYSVFEGEKSSIRQINIEGNDVTQDKVIRRELAIYPGEEFNTVNMRASENRLKNLGYFERAEFNVSDTGIPGQKDINIVVQEKPTGTINFGAGFSSIDNLVGFVDLVQTNFDYKDWPRFNGAGQKFRISAKYGTERRDFVINFTEPWLFDKRLALGLEGFYHEYRFLSDYFDQRSFGGEISLRRPLTDHAYLRAYYKPQNLEVYRVASDASEEIMDEEGNYLEHVLGLSYVLDTRDNVYLPRQGYKISIGGDVAFGDIETYGFQASGIQYFSLPFDTILSLEGSFRTIDNYGGDGVPIVEREFLGGANNLRGFDFREVGPVDENDEPLGGRTAAYVTAEYSVPVMNKVRFAVFADAGSVSAAAWDVDDINADVGIGLRLFLPLGQVRLDYGIPVASEDYNDSSGKFNFTMGTRFR